MSTTLEESHKPSDTASPTHQSNMTIIPGIIVDQCRSIRHSSNLISIIPPTHNSGVGIRIARQPKIGFPKIIEYLTRTADENFQFLHCTLILRLVIKLCLPITSVRGQNDTGTRVSVARHPRAMGSEQHQQQNGGNDDDTSQVHANIIAASVRSLSFGG